MTSLRNSVQTILKNLELEKGVLLDCAGLTERMELEDFCKIERRNELTEDTVDENVEINAILIDGSLIEKFDQESFQGVYRKIKNNDITLIVCNKNPINKKTVLEVLAGQKTELLDIHGYTKAGISELMQRQGFELIAEEKLESAECEIMDDNTFLAKESTVYKYFSWLERYVGAGLTAEYFIQAYKAVSNEKKDEECDKEKPFLSIVTRTQGRRVEALRETFLSLQGQESMDFEVLVMGHNLNERERRNVETLIEETPEYLRKKIRFVRVDGGNRSTPINRGFELAKGEYGVILDDDDIVFDHWVSSFKKKAKEFPGRVIHAYVIAQDWQAIQGVGGVEILRACGSPQNQFCRNFHLINELNGNYCPVLGLAFPLFPFRKMKFRFDETLDTTEDWDYLMRISCICGVVDVQEPTSMYRLWKNMENSHSVHGEEEWIKNRNRIQNRLRKRPLLLPIEYMDEMIQVAEKNTMLYGKEREKRYGQFTPLYYDNGNGFNEECVKRVGSKPELPEIYYEYKGFDAAGLVSSIRWDPYETGNVYVENIKIVITTEEGKVIEKKIPQMYTNGFKSGNQIVFFHPDPQIIIRFKKKICISKIIITGLLSEEITEDMHNYLAMQYDANVVQKTKKAVKIVGKKILRK